MFYYRLLNRNKLPRIGYEHTGLVSEVSVVMNCRLCITQCVCVSVCAA